MVLKQPNDRRLGENVNLPPGPPGAEFDTPDFGKWFYILVEIDFLFIRTHQPWQNQKTLLPNLQQ